MFFLSCSHSIFCPSDSTQYILPPGPQLGWDTMTSFCPSGPTRSCYRGCRGRGNGLISACYKASLDQSEFLALGSHGMIWLFWAGVVPSIVGPFEEMWLFKALFYDGCVTEPDIVSLALHTSELLWFYSVDISGHSSKPCHSFNWHLMQYNALIKCEPFYNYSRWI